MYFQSDPPETVCFQLARPTVNLYSLPQDCHDSLSLFHNLVKNDLEHLSLPQSISFIHCIDGIILIEPIEKVVTTLDSWSDTCASKDGGKSN